jgi:DNA-binding cell septation regulator SpoVG
MMHISIEHFTGKYPSFNVALSSTPDKEPFLVIKGCRIVDGNKGKFVSWPAKKMDTGKYWNHVYASDAFAAQVIKEAEKESPKKQKPTEDEIPF